MKSEQIPWYVRDLCDLYDLLHLSARTTVGGRTCVVHVQAGTSELQRPGTSGLRPLSQRSAGVFIRNAMHKWGCANLYSQGGATV